MTQAVLSTLHKSEKNMIYCYPVSTQPIQCVSETETEVKGAFKSQKKAYSVANTLLAISFKYNIIILCEINYFMIFIL